VKPGTILLTIEGLGNAKQVQLQGRAYDVTVRLAGRMEEERWF